MAHDWGALFNVRDGQTREDTTGQNQRDSNTQKQPELRVIGIFGEVIVGLPQSAESGAKWHGKRGDHWRECMA